MKNADPHQATLLSWNETRTLFHEFGHALHGLCSQVHYPSLAGTGVPRDYVEFPSQLLEHWRLTDRILKTYMTHHQTHQPIPDELIEKIKKGNQFLQGIATVEYLSSALIDLKLHLQTDLNLDPLLFEHAELNRLNMPNRLSVRYKLVHFQHIFGYSYSAGYYSYIWADSITADAAEYIQSYPEGYYDQEMARQLVESIFSKGDSIDPQVGYEQFRGQAVDEQALLRKRGLIANHPY